jgi:hypothetical protein
LQQGNYTAARAAANDVVKIVVTAYLINMQMPLTMIPIGRRICYSNYETNRGQATNHYASEDNGGRGGDIEIRNNYLNKFTDPNDERRNFNYLNPANNRILTNKFKINLATLVSFA